MTARIFKNNLLLMALVLLALAFLTGGKVFAASLVPCGSTENSSPCTLCHLVVGIKNIFDYLLYTVLFPLLMLCIVISGVLYMVSSGSKGLTEKAKTALTYSLTGFAIALTAWLMVNFVMLSLGFKNPLGGSWWTFTCDTSQSTTAATSTTTTTATTSAGTGDGTCGGIKISGVQACKYTTSGLDTLLNCINGKTTGTKAELIESESALQNCSSASWTKSGCVHMKNSCHYGGTNCSGQINGADLKGSDLNAIREAATACGGFSIYNEKNYRADGTTSTAEDHGTHVHVSPMNNCGCQ